MGLLDGKAGIITGAGRGIGGGGGGGAAASLLAAEGAKVVVADFGVQADGSGTDASVAQAKVDEITAAGGEATAVMADVTNPDDCDQIIQTCVDTYGQIDFAITVAGILRDRATWNMTDAEFDAVLNVHLKGTFYVGRAASRVLRQQRHGSLVTVTSVAHEGNFGQANYAAAKGAIASLTYTWAIELGRYGVTVNSVSPTAWTRLIATVPGATAPVPDEMPSGSPMGPPEGVAPLFAYLVSDEARWITGQIIGLGGERLTLFQHPREKLIIMQRGGYTLADLQRVIPGTFRGLLDPYGQLVTQYFDTEALQQQAEDRRRAR